MRTPLLRRLAAGLLLVALSVAVFSQLALAEETEPHSGGGGSGSTLVTTPTTQPPQVSGEALPQTGTDAGLWLGAGGGLVVLGGGLLALARRPRIRRH